MNADEKKQDISGGFSLNDLPTLTADIKHWTELSSLLKGSDDLRSKKIIAFAKMAHTVNVRKLPYAESVTQNSSVNNNKLTPVLISRG